MNEYNRHYSCIDPVYDFFSSQVTKFFFWAINDGSELTTSDYAVPDDSSIVTSFQSAGFTEAAVYSGATYLDVSESFGLYLEVETVFEEDYDSFKTILETWWQTNYECKFYTLGGVLLSNTW